MHMRKARDYDAELKALEARAKALKAKKVQQLGELVAATGADTLEFEHLAGLLLSGVQSSSTEEKEAWRAKGAAFFQRRQRKTPGGIRIDRSGDGEADPGQAQD